MSSEFAFVAPFALALLGAVVSLAADATGRARMGVSAGIVLLTVAAVSSLVAAATLAPTVVWTVFTTGAGYSMLVAVVMALAAAALLASLSSNARDNGSFAGLVTLSAAALGALAVSRDIIVVLLALETAAVMGYALVALTRTRQAHEAAMKYFVQGAVATALFVLGLSGAVLSGSLVFQGGRLVLGSSPSDLGAAVTSVVLIMAAFAFKLGAFPFHSWAPDAYETAPPEASAFLVSAVKVAMLIAMYGVLSVFMTQPSLTFRLQWLVAALAAGSIVFGNIAALAQRSYTRLLAYSGIAQVGYGLIAIVTGNGNAAVVFIVAYGLAAAGAFAVGSAFRALDPSWDGSIAGMAGLGQRARVLSLSLAVLLFSLTGIPPLFGFWGKLLVFLSAASDSKWLWLVFVGLLGSVVSFGYYGRVLRAVYFDDAHPDAQDEDEEAVRQRGRRARAATTAAAVLAVIIIAAGLVPLLSGLTRYVGVDPAGLFTITIF